MNKHTPDSDNPQEEWRRVPGMERVFIVSNLGRVRMAPEYPTKRAGEIARQFAERPIGHRTVSYSRNGKVRRAYVHRLVMLAFVGPCPEGKEVHHIDENPANNSLENLVYVTHRENLNASIESIRRNSPRGERVGSAKLTAREVMEIRRLHKTGNYSTIRLGKMFGVTSVNISCIVLRKSWKHIE